MDIRLALTGDIEVMQAIELDAGEIFRDVGLDSIADDDPPAPEALQSHIDSGTAWVADLDGETVGYLVATLVDEEGHIDQVSVRRVMRGKRIGGRLIETAKDWAIGRGLDSMTLTTFADLAWNGPYYARLGFEPLSADQIGPELGALIVEQRQAGIEVLPRIAMRLPLQP